MKKPSQVKNYVRYVATRPNAEKFEVNQSQREATEHQKRWIEKELKAHKELRESCEQEYEDYLQNPTRENAMELINKIAEEGLAREDSMENYVIINTQSSKDIVSCQKTKSRTRKTGTRTVEWIR